MCLVYVFRSRVYRFVGPSSVRLRELVLLDLTFSGDYAYFTIRMHGFIIGIAVSRFVISLLGVCERNLSCGELLSQLDDTLVVRIYSYQPIYEKPRDNDQISREPKIAHFRFHSKVWSMWIC